MRRSSRLRTQLTRAQTFESGRSHSNRQTVGNTHAMAAAVKETNASTSTILAAVAAAILHRQPQQLVPSHIHRIGTAHSGTHGKWARALMSRSTMHGANTQAGEALPRARRRDIFF